MDRQRYTTGQLARKAAVTVRTLRFYDKVGLLSPSERRWTGVRIYGEKDLWTLQQILALKFLGFSLEEIRVCLQSDTAYLLKTLAMQRTLLCEKRRGLDQVIAAIERAEASLRTDPQDWQAFIRVIQVIQMEQNKEWVSKYLTPEQQRQMAEISAQSYSEEAQRKLDERSKNWTEEDQRRASQQWDAFYAELRRLVARGKSPLDPESQALASQFRGLINQFTGGDPDIDAGLRQWWQNHEARPEGERPLAMYSYSEQEWQFLRSALEA